ncbi:MBL fold metallo-hydrolase [Stygiolobus caldivivus]|uniref:MBL fold metallo-hydrolase n=1 Tax=Stygiolobus caldivivus TaxID=2824673 RepID=A0A8D5ZHS0_9CREN|nr:MBL fold metallo-hydrolase [Stygiolobus caldivivus]BCU68956.1 MBL fold metallo-hydrolase [Stygiolobus caldivivus]
MDIKEIKLRFVKSFVITLDNGDQIIIDSGLPNSSQKILSKVDKNKVKYVIFTHSHIDHIGSAYELKNALPNAEFCIHKEGVKYLRGEEIRKPVVHSLLYKAVVEPFASITNKSFRGINTECTLSEGDFEDLEILYTPGHTSDSISIHIPQNNSVIVGDILQGTKEGLKVPIIYEDIELLLKSIQRIKEMKPRMIYVSHGENGNNILI